MSQTIAEIRELLANRNAGEAERHCRLVLEKDPDHPAVAALLCRALLDQNRAAEARELLDRLDSLPGASPAARSNLRRSLESVELRLLDSAIREALKAEDAVAARALLDGSELDPRKLASLRLSHVRLLMAEGRLDEAEAECGAIREEDPPTGCELLLCTILGRQGRWSEARDLFREVIWTGQFAPEQKARTLAFVSAGLSAEEAAEFLDDLKALRAPTPVETLRMAMFEIRIGRPSAALARLEAAGQGTGLSPVVAAQILVCQIQTGQFDDAMRLIDSMRVKDPDNPGWLHKQSVIHNLRHEHAAAARCVAEGLERWPGDHRLLKALQSAALSSAELEQLVARIDAVRRATRFDDVANLQFALAALQARAVGPARDALATGPSGGRAQHVHARDLSRLLSEGHTDFWLTHARFRADARQSIEVVHVPGAVATVVLFPNIRGSFGLLPLDFADALLSRYPVNVIALRDERNSAFLAPNEALGGSVAGLSAMLRQQARDLGDLPLLTFGTSSGGFSAMLQAARIGARGCVVFSGPVRLYSADDRPAASGQRVGLSFLTSIPEHERNVTPALKASPGLRLWHVAGAENADDVRQQALLSGLPGVERITMEGVQAHNTFVPAVSTGLFDRLVRNALEGLA